MHAMETTLLDLPWAVVAECSSLTLRDVLSLIQVRTQCALNCKHIRAWLRFQPTMHAESYRAV